MKSEQLTYECVKYTQVVGFFFSPFRFFGKRMIQFFWRLFYPVKWNRPDQLPDLTDLLQTDTGGGGDKQAYRQPDKHAGIQEERQTVPRRIMLQIHRVVN